MNSGEFKASANEVGNWLWGTAQGGFNEKQTIGQIVTDAVIAMFPISGEVTAARDVIAAGLRLAQYPEKRQETVEWVALVLPLLAVVPLLGGALKGVGKLLLRAGRSIDEDRKILDACVWLLNRVGRGDAPRFIKTLDFTAYGGAIKTGAREVFRRLDDGITFITKKFGGLIPERALANMAALQNALAQVATLVDRMVPQALKDLNNRLKYIQSLVYQGEWHLIPGAGRAVTRETEARLVNDALLGKEVWKLEGMRWPQNEKEVFTPRVEWPDLAVNPTIVRLANGDKLRQFDVIAAFSGPITARELQPGTVVYRVISPDPWSRAEGAWWTAVDPKSITGWFWRVYAVCQSWSANGKYVKFVVKDKPLHAWEGKVSSQIDQTKMLRDGSHNPAFGQYLEGGEKQLYIDFNHASNAHALADAKGLTKLDTNWLDHMNINIPERGATVQKLGTHVVEQKSLASANLASAANQASHGAQAAREH